MNGSKRVALVFKRSSAAAVLSVGCAVLSVGCANNGTNSPTLAPVVNMAAHVASQCPMAGFYQEKVPTSSGETISIESVKGGVSVRDSHASFVVNGEMGLKIPAVFPDDNQVSGVCSQGGMAVTYFDDSNAKIRAVSYAATDDGLNVTTTDLRNPTAPPPQVSYERVPRAGEPKH